MTSACAFTDYFLQGQTISHAIVDIARPPSCGPNLFNLYYLVCCIIQEFRPCRHPIDFDEKKVSIHSLSGRSRGAWSPR
ncbi:hypothetical protein EV401DRAFT_1861126 [Pisolithus croceorrhizus]|nr:hypothetical protein EV401DRAFT_1861126 [Pisolithus croceorrhizus]